MRPADSDTIAKAGVPTVLAGLIALTYVVITPVFVATKLQFGDAAAISVDHGVRIMPAILVAIQLLAAGAAVIAFIAMLAGKYQVARHALLLAAVTGPVPAILPGVFAAVARGRLASPAGTV